jgi:hypothetical protein
MSPNALMKHTYIHYPYWGINSIKANEILSEKEFERITNSRPRSDKTILFTIDYEGISLEEY